MASPASSPHLSTSSSSSSPSRSSSSQPHLSSPSPKLGRRRFGSNRKLSNNSNNSDNQMYSTGQNVYYPGSGNPYRYQQSFVTPYQYQMMQPAAIVQQFAHQLATTHGNGIAMPQVNTMEDLKAVPCPYLKNKGHCRFDENRCRYSHQLSQTASQEGDETEEELSFDKLPAESSQESPKTNDTSPPQAGPATNGKTSGVVAVQKQHHQAAAVVKHHQQQPVQAYPANGTGNSNGKLSVTLNPPSKLYTAYEATTLPDEQVYRITNRKYPLDETLVSYIDEKTGQRVTRTNIQEIRFEKPFGKVFDVHVQTITSRENLAKSLAYLSVANASSLTDEAVLGLGIICNPKVVILNGAVGITDAAFIGLCINAKGLEYLEVTGYDRRLGRLTSSSLRMLLESPTIAPNLKEVVVKHQSISSQTALELSKARPNLAITTGYTVPGSTELNVYLWSQGRLAFVNNFVIE